AVAFAALTFAALALAVAIAAAPPAAPAAPALAIVFVRGGFRSRFLRRGLRDGLRLPLHLGILDLPPRRPGGGGLHHRRRRQVPGCQRLQPLDAELRRDQAVIGREIDAEALARLEIGQRLALLVEDEEGDRGRHRDGDGSTLLPAAFLLDRA